MTRPHDAQTPRTDDKARELTFGHTWGERWNGLLFHARQLERELQAERERGRRVREETIEECARLCDAAYKAPDATAHDLMYEQGYHWGAEKCEQSIRAISRAESAPEGGK